MTASLVFFDNLSDLQSLTGLTHDQLWEAGFNLDDWDFGFVSPVEFSEDWEHPQFERWLLQNIASYYAGHEHVLYNGKHYYMCYHS